MKSMTKVLTIILVSMLALSLVPIVADNPASANPTGQAWTKYTGELTMGGLRAVVDSWVIKDGATYKMWFTRLNLNETETEVLSRLNDLGTYDFSDFIDDILAQDLDSLLDKAATLDAADMVALLDSATTVIGYATSTDGITWTVQNNDVLNDGGGILTGEGTPTVVNIGGTYHMWYTRAESDLVIAADWTPVLSGFGETQANRKTAVETVLNGTRTVIGHATSTDGGLTWGSPNDQVFPAVDGNLGDSVGAPCVIYDSDDTTYKMWYTRTESDLTMSQWADALIDTGNADFDAAIGVLDGTAAVIGYAESANGTTWTVQNSKVLPSSTPVWESVGDPCVVKVGSTYHMWYTGARTNLTRTGVDTIWSELQSFSLGDIWTALAAKDVGDILDAILALDLTTIKTTLASTNTAIGYATSGNGTTWAIQSASDLAGSTGGLWSSVAAPTVIESGGSYEMWFTEGINDLTVGKLADIYLGSDLPIGRATATPLAPPPPPPPPPDGEEEAPECVEGPGVTCLSEDMVEDGLFLTEVTATTEDGQAWVTVPEGTTGLTAEGEPLTFISATEMEMPPPPPPDHSMVALTYTFGPEGATFDPPVGITLSYSEADLPAGFNEEDIVIVVWDEVTGEWIKLLTVVDTVNNTVTTYVTHFSTFAVVLATAPASFQTSNLTVMPDEVEIDEDVTISVLVENTGDLSGSYILELMINNEVAETKEISLAGHGNVTVSFTISKEADGTYAISINGLTGRFTVTAPPVIVPPKPADIFTSNLSVTPSRVEPGDTVTISVRVANRGGQEGTYLVELKIDGVVVETEMVKLAAGASQTVTFTTSEDMGGIYTVDIDDLSASFTVVKPEIEDDDVGTNWALIGGIIGGVVVIAIVVGILLWRRRRY
ncbi:MAG TPA: CARDB domain-containing protein [Dehalococcoidales bacterium]|nr:CARDB domain-containing protein [Dehalococcoidales bacterium]